MGIKQPLGFDQGIIRISVLIPQCHLNHGQADGQADGQEGSQADKWLDKWLGCKDFKQPPGAFSNIETFLILLTAGLSKSAIQRTISKHFRSSL